MFFIARTARKVSPVTVAARSAKTVTRIAILLLASVLIAGAFLPVVASAQTTPPATSSLIVKLVAGLTADEQTAVVARNGGIEVSTIAALRLHVIQVLTADLASVLAQYQADPQVASAEENKVRQSETVPTDPLYPAQWSLPQIQWDLVFGAVTPIGSATVAILDTGIDATHPDLASHVVAGTSMLDSSHGTTDPNGHGTWMAGIVAAQTNTVTPEGIAGIAYTGVRMMPVTVLDSNGLGQDSDVIAGVIWAADHGADVILMGFSNPGFSENLQDAIDYAWSKGIILVAAVGNGAAGTPTFPAGDRGVIGVSATDATDNLAGFSNWGGAAFLAAPGTNIQTTDLAGSYGVISGTSASAAIVTGVAGFMKAVDPTLSNGVIVGRMARMADPAGTQDQTGNGRINMARALSDTGTGFIEPAGADPVGNGGPFVGPYRAAALNSLSVGSQTGSVTYGTAGSVTYTITPSGTGQTNGAVSVTWAVPGAPIGVTVSPSSSGPCNLSQSSCTFTLTITTATATPAVSRSFTVAWSGVTSSNSGTLTVSTVPLTVRANDKTRVFGVANPTFDVSYSGFKNSDTSASLGGTLSCVTTATPASAPGPYPITCSGQTSTNYTITYVAATLTVTKADQATLTVNAPASLTYGSTATLTSSGGSGVGAVTFSAGASTGCAVSGAVLSVADASGTCAVTATKSGDTNFNGPVTSAAATVTLLKATQATLTVNAPASLTYGNTATLTSSGGSGTGVLTFSAGASTGCSLTGDQLAVTNASGTCAVTTTKASDNNYNAASSAAAMVTLQQATQAITFGALADKHFGDPDFTVGATGGASGQPVTFTAAGSCTVTGGLVDITTVGGCTITAHQAGDTNYSAAPDVPQSFQITDNTPPETSVDSGPTSPTKSTTATFTFSGTDDVTPPASLTFECQLDSGSFSTCTSPKTYTGLADASHTFHVRASDAAGNVDTTPASFSWSVDTVPPDTLLDSMPFDPTNSTTATFTFHSTEPSSSLECSLSSSLNAGAFAPCSSPTVYSGLADDTYTFQARATDAAGNADPTPTSFTWTVDTQAPDTLIDSAPNSITNSNTATFTFYASEGSTFECSLSTLNAGAFAPCSSPATYSGLADGAYTFQVRATDAAGNTDQSPASFSWIIDTAAPETSITTGPADGSTTTDTSAAFDFTGTDDVSQPQDLTFECSLDGAPFTTCTSPASYSGLSRQPHTFAVRAKDQAGNMDASPATRTWTIEKIAPVITWTTPADITYPTALSGTQLNATANVAGTFAYTPESGTILNAGTGQTLSVLFTPTDTVNYSTATKSVLINVLKATPVITWANPADITYPTALSGTQLNATADVPGSFVYTPAAGTVLNASVGQTLKVDFTPTDTTNYSNASKTVSITVLKGNQTINVTLSAPGSALYNTSFGVAATGGPSGQPVAIAASGVCSGGGNGAAAITMTSGTGACTVTYNQAGDSNYNAAAQVNSSTAAEKASQTITVTTPAPAGATFNTSFGVAASASSGLPVAITASGVCTGGGSGSASITMNSGTGSCTVTFNQAGDSNYNAAAEVAETTAAQLAATTTTITAMTPEPSEAGTPYTVSASVSGSGGTPTGTLAVSDGVTSCEFSAPAGSCSLTSSGSVTLTATYGGDTNFSESSVTRAHQVVDTAPIVGPDHPSVTADEGQTATNTGTYADPTPGEDITITASVGSVTKTGTNSGTWSWSFAATDGPTQSQTVTITADDGKNDPVMTTFALVVNNVAPTIAISGAPASSPEGTKIDLESTVNDPSGPDAAAGYTYGWSVTKDGSAFAAGSDPKFSFTPDDNGTYVVTLTAQDKDGGVGSTSQTINVTNVAPSGTGLALLNADNVAEGSPVTLLGAFTDPGTKDTHTVEINWGDGSTTTLNLAVGEMTFGADHAYLDNGDITINATITDKDGGTGAMHVDVTVNDVGPTITQVYVIPESGDLTKILENQSVTVSADFTDPGTKDTHTVDVDWGDGPAHTTFSLAAGALTFSTDHQYLDNGSFNITVTVTDKDGLSANTTVSINVADVPPAATITGAQASSPEGTTIALGSTATDPSAKDTTAGFTYTWSVTKNGSPFASVGPALGLTGFSFTPDDNGSYVVTLAVADKDGKTGTDTATIAVTNVAPTATLAAPASVMAGTSINLSLNGAADPSTADAAAGFTYAYDCGSGSYSASSSASCATPVSFSTTTRTVRGSIRDKDGGYTERSATVQVTPTQYTFTGFFSPVANGTVNSVNAPQAIPMKWTLALNGAAVTDPKNFVNLTSYKADCTTWAQTGAMTVEPASGGSGLQNLGSGNWQYNWKLDKSYAGTCRVGVLNLQDGSTHTAKFQIR